MGSEKQRSYYTAYDSEDEEEMDNYDGVSYLIV